MKADTSTPKQFNVRLNLTGPMIVVIVLMALLMVVSVIYIEEESIHQTKAEVTHQFTLFLDEKVHHEAAAISEYMGFIQGMDKVAKLFEKRDKEALYHAVAGMYAELNRKVDLTHMYFIEPDGTVLLRVHDYRRDGDRVGRTTFLRAKEKRALYYGIEFGLKKNYTLRVVKPWIVDGVLIGYLELGKEIDKIINEYAQLLGTQVYLAVKKSVYADAPAFVRSKLEGYARAGEYYIVYRTFDVPPQIGAILDGSIERTDISFEKGDYFVAKSPLTDVSGRDLGFFVFLSDVTLEHRVIEDSVKAFALVLGVISMLLFYVGYRLLKRKETDINALTSELKAQKEVLERFSVKLQKIFDLQRNIVILTDGETLQMANRAMFDFFGLEDLHAFLKYYTCICERFVENDNFFHLGRVEAGRTWVDAIAELPGEQRVVAMLDRELVTHVFSVSINAFEEGNHIVTFSDISNTMLEQLQLKNKVIHDKLTGAFNREFLEKSMERIVREAAPQHVGVVLCDIDHFKRVNDRYGHNRGDTVLKQFVAILQHSIRSEDYLIRWGGEEFVILMRVDSSEVLEKAVEHTRRSIENGIFDEVGSVTSSFGATLRRDAESLAESIGRADRALYRAKAEGRNRVCME